MIRLDQQKCLSDPLVEALRAAAERLAPWGREGHDLPLLDVAGAEAEHLTQR
jgi:hypothetical protein